MAPSGSIRVRSPIAVVLVASIVSIAVSACVPPSARENRTPADSTASDQDPADEVSVVWSWVHGSESKSTPPFLSVAPPGETVKEGEFGSESLTIILDLEAEVPPTLALLLVHCDREWNPTQNIFIQDPSKLRANDVRVDPAPIGVQNYDFTATVTFPSSSNNVDLSYSGNYIARIVDYYNTDRVIAEVRFFAVESTAGVDVETFSDFFESAWTDQLQEGLRARVEITPATNMIGSGFEAVHLLERGKWKHPMIASEETMRRNVPKGGYRTTWSPWYGGRIIAEYSNIPSGNEHRILDLTDFTRFPSNSGLISRAFSDQDRDATFGEYDNNGIPQFNYVPTGDDDYVYFEFRLDLESTKIYDDMAVVGTFNDWTPTWDWRLVYDRSTNRYVARGWLKRAVHEYQYVTGEWNVDKGVLERAEPTLLEGNSVYATKHWYALAYYQNQTSLKYDRIVGVGIDVSGGR